MGRAKSSVVDGRRRIDDTVAREKMVESERVSVRALSDRRSTCDGVSSTTCRRLRQSSSIYASPDRGATLVPH